MSVVSAPPHPTAAALVLGRRPHPSATALAGFLASAFLAADSWSRPGLLAAGWFVRGARRRWLGPLVSEVLASHHLAPTDAPRELTATVARCAAFTAAVAAAAGRGIPIDVAHHSVAPSRALRICAPLPRLDTLADLAALLELSSGELAWFADTGQWNRSARTGALHHYRSEWLVRAGRTPGCSKSPAVACAPCSARFCTT